MKINQSIEMFRIIAILYTVVMLGFMSSLFPFS